LYIGKSNIAFTYSMTKKQRELTEQCITLIYSSASGPNFDNKLAMN